MPMNLNPCHVLSTLQECLQQSLFFRDLDIWLDDLDHMDQEGKTHESLAEKGMAISAWYSGSDPVQSNCPSSDYLEISTIVTVAVVVNLKQLEVCRAEWIEQGLDITGVTWKDKKPAYIAQYIGAYLTKALCTCGMGQVVTPHTPFIERVPEEECGAGILQYDVNFRVRSMLSCESLDLQMTEGVY